VAHPITISLKCLHIK